MVSPFFYIISLSLLFTLFSRESASSLERTAITAKERYFLVVVSVAPLLLLVEGMKRKEEEERMRKGEK